MGFAERAAQRKKSKDLKNELKQLKKEMTAGGCDKEKAAALSKELQETLEQGEQLATGYENAREHMEQAKASIVRLLDCMGESPVGEVKESLKTLVDDLGQVYHECAIRLDDMDFQSTLACLKRMVQEFDGNTSIMLRSELENVNAVLDDALGWMPPDFMALAYFARHEDRNELKEMENEQRNKYVAEYYDTHFYRELKQQADRAGVWKQVRELIDSHI
jgi:hypothetical protein